MEAQIVGGLGHPGIERRIAGEAKYSRCRSLSARSNLLDSTGMAIGPPNDAGVLPVFAQAFGHVLDDTSPPCPWPCA
jgi:hypothetical protein